MKYFTKEAKKELHDSNRWNPFTDIFNPALLGYNVGQAGAELAAPKVILKRISKMEDAKTAEKLRALMQYPEFRELARRRFGKDWGKAGMIGLPIALLGSKLLHRKKRPKKRFPVAGPLSLGAVGSMVGPVVFKHRRLGALAGAAAGIGTGILTEWDEIS